MAAKSKKPKDEISYPGVYWRTDQKGVKTYYIRYRLDYIPEGRTSNEVNEKAGSSDKGMTAAKASNIRADRMRGKADPNAVKRVKEKAAKEAAAGRWTIQKIWDEYDEAHKARSCAKPDISYFAHIPDEMKEKVPADIVTLDLERLRRNLAKTKSPRTGKTLSAQTQKHVLALLKRMLRWAADMGHIEAPSHLKFKMPSVDNEKTEFMSQDQLEAYLKALDEEPDQDDAAFFRLALFTGIRKTALLNLQWTDVDLENGFLTLRGDVAKNEKTQTVPLSESAVEVLQRITRRESSYVWPGADGGPREGFTRLGRRLRKNAGLPKDFRPVHGLRHHFASHLASSGASLYEVGTLLTHGDLSVTKRYAHLSDQALRKAVELVNDMVKVKKKAKVSNITDEE